MSGFEVQTQELLGARSAVLDAAEQARAELARLAAGADDVLGWGWRSPAAAQFRRGWEQWHAGAAGVLAALEEMGAALGATARTYAEHEAAAAPRLAS